ncbi:retron St85 family RNA-directed DNA polymerase [Phenylobacterium sp.]|uniref:retron St85 family RNA-directed DNA polymerase n=1 Tax=Phenylobacterium sp. TaxID=1871053 RepID=UPI002721C3D7|nr:retron St85 family RNA-directed DNA polymerase [Phenylobacterium sp.]MDO8377613.1 retron St85 family RNA-directed DNA polymerase [Phenylobacterium sp.]
MSLRTYPLIAHPAFIDFVTTALRERVAFEKVVLPPPHHEMPHLTSVQDIATYLGISPELGWSVITSPRRNYRQFPINKRSGGVRIISAPRTYLKVMQWWLLDVVLSNVEISDHAYGFVRGRSFVDNAKRHVGATHILNVDIRDFFPSIKRRMVEQVFINLGYEERAAVELSLLTTFDDELPQGAPTSPALANIVFQPFDIALQTLCAPFDIVYTRYADDLTFSSSERIPDQFLTEVTRLIGPAFVPNEQKTKYMGPNQRKEVTGVQIGKDGVCLSRETLNAMRGWFHSMNYVDSPSREDVDRLQGTVAMLRMIGGRGSATIIGLGDAVLKRLKPKKHADFLYLLDDLKPKSS